MALTRILADRIQEARGKALPRTSEQLARADVVNDLFHRFRPAGASALPHVSSVHLPGVDFESSNCKNFLIELEFDEVSAEATPKTLYAKLPCDELATRIFANAVGFWPLECIFCERVAQHVPIRVPRVYAVARRGSRFVLLLENLLELPNTHMFTNRDMAAGTTVERARLCLDTFAELHAAFWGWAPEPRDALLPTETHTFLAPGRRAMTRAMNAAAIGPAHRAAPTVFTSELVALCRMATEKWDLLLKAWYREPLTLVHGDSHLANCFEYATPNGPRMGMIDFQAVHWSHGIRDVQYFLINSLDPELLAANEDALIDHYIAALAGHGVTLDGKIAREQYRAFSFQTLMVGVVPLGLGPLTERDATVRTVLERGVAAVRRLGFEEWLRKLG